MTLPGLVMLVLSQVVMVLVVSLSLFLVIDDFVEGSAQFLGGATALAVIVVDALVLTGVIGRGWPPSTETNTELLLGSFVGAALLILAVGIEEDEVGAVATGIVGLILIGLGEGLLLAGLIWPQHHVTAEPPTLGATTAPGRTPAPTVTVIRTVTATPVSAPAPTVTVVRTVTAAPGHAPTPTVTVTQTVKGTPGSAPTTANPAPAANQSPSGAVTAAIAVAGAGGTLLGGLGTLLVGWVAIAERRKNSEKTPAPPP